MKLLLVSPLAFPINESTVYAGIEKLVYEYSRELIKSQEVSVIGHTKSIFPPGVELLPCHDIDYYHAEIRAFQSYQYLLRNYDAIHDFSHLHLASRFVPNLPSLNIFWHAPALVQYPKAPYNIIALSRWAAREFEFVYRQRARYQQSILIDTSLYKLSDEPRNDRFLAIGRMGQEKGNLNAVMLCLKAGVPLDIITARGGGYTKEDEDYERQVQSLCDGDKIKIIWDYTEADKIRYMQTSKALLYVTDHPEVTSHKVQECLLCGLPAIVSNIGAASEVVTQGVDGYLCRTEDDFMKAIEEVDKLNTPAHNENLKQRYGVENVVREYLPLYEEVKKGLRW